MLKKSDMAESINLLQTTKVEKKERSLFFSISLLFLLISVILGVGLLLYTTYLKTKVSTLAVEKSKMLIQMQTYNEQRIKFLTVKERLRAIYPIITNNIKFNQTFVILEQNIPTQLNLADMKINKSSIFLTLTSNDLLSINEFLTDSIEKIISQDRLVKAITINNFSIDKSSGGYSLGITVAYSKNLLSN